MPLFVDCQPLVPRCIQDVPSCVTSCGMLLRQQQTRALTAREPTGPARPPSWEHMRHERMSRATEIAEFDDAVVKQDVGTLDVPVEHLGTLRKKGPPPDPRAPPQASCAGTQGPWPYPARLIAARCGPSWEKRIACKCAPMLQTLRSRNEFGPCRGGRGRERGSGKIQIF